MWCFPGSDRTMAHEDDVDDDDDDDDDDDEVGYILGVLCKRITPVQTSYTDFARITAPEEEKKPNKKSICSSKLNRIQLHTYWYSIRNQPAPPHKRVDHETDGYLRYTRRPGITI